MQSNDHPKAQPAPHAMDADQPGLMSNPPTAVESALGKSAEHLLRALAARAAALASGRAPAPPPRVATAAVEVLVSADLAARRADGTLAITPAGMAHLARLEFARNGSAIDPFLGQHLPLAQS